MRILVISSNSSLNFKKTENQTSNQMSPRYSAELRYIHFSCARCRKWQLQSLRKKVA